MSRTHDEQAHTGRLEQQYRDRTSEVFLEIEHEALGCNYGGTSWTARGEAERMAELLPLRSGIRALEIGAGSGWPGIFLSRRSGCAVTLLDLPREGLRIARRRARRVMSALAPPPCQQGSGLAAPPRDGPSRTA